MSRAIGNVNTSTDTFQNWIDKTNVLVTALTESVTIASNTAGDMTTGNGFVTGIFGANTIVASTLRGGNVQSNSSLTIASNTSLGNSSVNVTLSHNSIALFKSNTITTSNTNLQVVDSFPIASYRGGKYVISIKNTDNNDYQMTEIIAMHDGTNTLSTEYATLVSNTTLAQFTTDINSGNFRLLITPTLANNVVKFNTTMLAV